MAFLAEKMEGETIEKIMDTVMDPDKMATINEEYSQKNQPEEDADCLKLKD